MISGSCTLQETQHFRPVVSRLLRHKNEMYNHRHGAEEYVRFIAVSATPKALPTSDGRGTEKLEGGKQNRSI